MRLSEILSVAGGVTPTGADSVILMTTRDGRPQRLEIDLVDMFTTGDLSKDVVLQAGRHASSSTAHRTTSSTVRSSDPASTRSIAG